MASFDFDFSQTTLVIRHLELDQFLNDPSGDVGKYMKRRGQLIVLAAKNQVGVRTGALKASIHMIHTRGAGGQLLWIGSNNSIAYIHHEGTKPHTITARSGHQMLRFTSGGRVIYSRSVMHPGTRPNRYLSDNLRLVRA